MKRVLVMIGIIVCLAVVMTGADLRPIPADHKIKKNCFGYTIIEAGKGINCYGDTILLKKNFGFYEMVARTERKSSEEKTVIN